MRKGNSQHEYVLEKYVNEQRKLGKKIVNLQGKCPDGIEVLIENGRLELIALEVLPHRWSQRLQEWRKYGNEEHKKILYEMFDSVKIIRYDINLKIPQKKEWKI